MKASLITRIAVSLSIDEARNAIVNATDLQLALRAELYKIEPPTIVEQIANHKNGRKQLAAPKRRQTIECPHCHKKICASKRFEKHVAGHAAQVEA
jgi:hypothetical protein